MSGSDGRVLITGASSGLGRELARLYASSGRNLVLTARRGDRLLQLKNELEHKFSIKVLIVVADLAHPSGADGLIRTIHEAKMEVDGLVNSAGMGIYGEFAQMNFHQIKQMYQVNVLSVLRLTQLVLSDMKLKNKGHIVNIASLGAFFPGPLMSVYFASKSDLLSFAAAVNYELRNSDIKITTICPGPFKSEFQAKAFGRNRHTQEEKRLPSSCVLARLIFRDILKRKEIIVPGIRNQIIVRVCRFVPQSWILPLVYREQAQL